MLMACNRDTPSGARAFALISTLATTCQPARTILHLRWGDITRTRDAHFKFRYIDNDGSTHWAPMRREVHQAIIDYLKIAKRYPTEEEAYVFTPLFPNRSARLGHAVEETNRPLSNSHANTIIQTCARRAGVDETIVHLHGLRHAGARERYRQAKARESFNLEEFSEFLGHSNTTVTHVYRSAVLEDLPDPAGDAAAEVFVP